MKSFDKLEKDMKEHFGDSSVQSSGDVLQWSTGSKTFLELHRDGSVKAGMPLHQFELDNVEEVRFSEEGVRIIGQGLDYIFRK